MKRLTEKTKQIDGSNFLESGKIYLKDKITTNDLDSSLSKLSQLEDIEEELGIDLITLFKALREKGIWIMWNNQIVNVEPHHLRVEIDCSKPLIGSIKIQELYFEDLDCIMDTTGEEWFMDEYGKTWALDKKELTKEN